MTNLPPSDPRVYSDKGNMGEDVRGVAEWPVGVAGVSVSECYSPAEEFSSPGSQWVQTEAGSMNLPCP